MRATENQGSFLNRISIRRNQVVSMDGHHEQDLEDLDLFLRHVADRFSDLLDSPEPLLSIAWLRKLLDAFLCCEAQFKALLIASHLSKPPLDRLVPDLLDRSVKALDVCNAATHGLDALRHCQKLAEIAVHALQTKPLGDGQVRRAHKALAALAAEISPDDRDGESSGKSTERAWSFGKRGGGGSASSKEPSAGRFRSTWWGMARGWSSAKQIQAMSANLAAPRGAAEASGMAQPIYVMSSLTVFVMWAVVAAIQCQERAGLAPPAHISGGTRQAGWAQAVTALQERIGEEWRRKEKRGSAAGLMEEMQRVERAGQALAEFAESYKHPAEADRAEDAAAHVAELAEACQRMEDGLVPLQRQIREVFHKIVRTRTEVLEVFDQGGKFSAPAM